MPIPEHQTPPTIPTGPAMPASGVPRVSAGVVQVQSAAIASAVGSNLLKAKPNVAFFLAHHPESWEVRTEGLIAPTWLPEVLYSPVMPGVNGHRTRPKNAPFEWAYEQAHDKLRRKGCRVILWQDAMVRKADGSVSAYITEAKCRNPRPPNEEGLFYMDAWDVPRSVRQGKRIKFRRDFAGFNLWRLFLVEAGIVAPPDPDLIGPECEQVERAEYHLDRKAGKVINEDLREREVSAQRIKVDRLKSARIPQPRRELLGLTVPPIGYRGFGEVEGENAEAVDE